MADPLEDLKQRVCEAVDALSDTLLAVSHEIHANPELAFEEHAASALLVSTLEQAGLDVEPGAYGLETAFSTSTE
jgi:metal-dependent amidase/aminoacylase/carboxypeptidase family protein